MTTVTWSRSEDGDDSGWVCDCDALMLITHDKAFEGPGSSWSVFGHDDEEPLLHGNAATPERAKYECAREAHAIAISLASTIGTLMRGD